MNTSPRESEQFWHQCTLVLILVIAACARFYSLDQVSLSPDGLTNLAISQTKGWWAMATANQAYSGMTPLYPTLLSVTANLTSDGEFFIRSLSALFGLAAIYIIYITGRDFISPAAGLLAAAIMATEFQTIYLNRDVTLYSLLMLLCLIHNYSFYRLFFSVDCYHKRPLTLRYHSRSSNLQASWQPDFPADACCLLGFWVSGALAFYTSPMALIQLASEVVASAFLIKKATGIFPQGRIAMRSLWLPLFIVILPWLPILYGYRHWIMQGHLVAFQSPDTLWQRIQEILPINPSLMKLAIAMSVLLILFIAGTRLLKKNHLYHFPLICFIVFQFSIASLCLWLIIPASPLSNFYYWWVFILIILIPVSVIIDLLPSFTLKKVVIATVILLIVIVQAKSNAYYKLYEREKGGDFRLAAKIIHDDQDFMKSDREIVMSSKLFEHHLEASGITLTNFTLLDANTAPDNISEAANNSTFYYLEFAPYDRELQNETTAYQALTNQYKKVCVTKIPWIRIVKFSRDPAVTENEVQDCQTHLSDTVSLQ